MNPDDPIKTVKIYVTYRANGCHRGIACPDPVYVEQSDTLLQFEMQPGDFIFDPEHAIVVRDGEGNFVGSWTVTPDNANLVALRLTYPKEYHYDVCYQYKPVLCPPQGQQQERRSMKLTFEFDPTIINGSE
jgi:hypothetical protein